MGMQAYILMVVPFSEKIKPYLKYPSEYYDDVVVGTHVCVTFFRCPTNTMSYEMGKVVGIDSWDFNTHNINIDKVDRSKVYDFILENSGNLDEVSYDGFFKCAETAKTIMFMPNG